jgi:hypothetical protein
MNHIYDRITSIVVERRNDAYDKVTGKAIYVYSITRWEDNHGWNILSCYDRTTAQTLAKAISHECGAPVYYKSNRFAKQVKVK